MTKVATTDILEVIKRLPANAIQSPKDIAKLAGTLNLIKSGAALGYLDTNHKASLDLWKSILKQSIELKKLIKRAQVNPSPVETMVGGPSSIVSIAYRYRAPPRTLGAIGKFKQQMETLEELNRIAEIRIDIFSGIAKGRSRTRSPAKEYYYRSLLELWTDCGGRLSKSKEGPLHKFLVAGCAAIKQRPPGPDAVPAIVDRFRCRSI